MCSSDLPTVAHSGTQMWGTVLNDCYTALANSDGFSSGCDNMLPNDDSILSFKVNIPATWTTAAELKYWSWEDIYGNDWFEVRINGEAVAATTVCPSQEKDPGWQEVQPSPGWQTFPSSEQSVSS